QLCHLRLRRLSRAGLLVWGSADAWRLRQGKESLLVTPEKLKEMEEEVLRVEKGFANAIAKNDPEGIERFVTDEWIIINADGGIIDKERFLGVIKSGALTHEMMESDDIRVRVYGASAVITALTRTKWEFMGQAFSTQELATDVFVRLAGRGICVLSQLTRISKLL